MCLSEFKETPRTKVAKKYLKDDPIMEDENESMTQSNYHQTGRSSIGVHHTMHGSVISSPKHSRAVHGARLLSNASDSIKYHSKKDMSGHRASHAV